MKGQKLVTLVDNSINGRPITVVCFRFVASTVTRPFDLFHTVAPAYEGVTWLRGRHAPESDAARALLASYAIARS